MDMRVGTSGVHLPPLEMKLTVIFTVAGCLLSFRCAGFWGKAIPDYAYSERARIMNRYS